MLNQQLEEMDKVEVVEAQAGAIRYEEKLVSVFRDIVDPFDNQLRSLSYEPNPTDMTQLTKQIEFASGQPDGASEAN